MGTSISRSPTTGPRNPPRAADPTGTDRRRESKNLGAASDRDPVEATSTRQSNEQRTFLNEVTWKRFSMSSRRKEKSIWSKLANRILRKSHQQRISVQSEDIENNNEKTVTRYFIVGQQQQQPSTVDHHRLRKTSSSTVLPILNNPVSTIAYTDRGTAGLKDSTNVQSRQSSHNSTLDFLKKVDDTCI